MKLRGFLAAACGVLLAGSASLRAEEVDMTAGPAPKGKPWEAGWGFWPDYPKAWQQTHQGLVKKAAGGADLVFIGDSITAGWGGAGKEAWKQRYEPLGTVNLGIGGDTTRQLLWRIDHGTLEGLKPRAVVLMIGVNNIFQNNGTDEEIARGVEAVITAIRGKLPDARILLLSILPQKSEGTDKRIQEVNSRIRKLAGSGVTWFDLGKSFRDAEGKPVPAYYTEDGTHLGADGYKHWGTEMEPALEALLK